MTNHLIVFAYILAMISQIIIFPCHAKAQELFYDIYSNEKKTGSITVKLSEINSNETNLLKVETHTKIQVKALFISLFSLDSQEEGLINDEGTYSYSSVTIIDGDTIRVTGKLKDAVFKLTVTEGEKKQNVSIKRSNYDFTSLDSPELFLEASGKPKIFKILDFDNLAVVKQNLKWIRNEELNILDDTVDCKVIEFENPGEKGTRWITQDQYGLLIKEEGEDEDGKYTVKISKFQNRIGN
ncbi:MAG: hypothetical protein B6244_03220 [Candidatus Cloacimonetes bacterium 4572_55]|nr:MAG: hypothetical protein B6244_03220 [Candidatus Cloacimonetes bacterium 4572_55]